MLYMLIPVLPIGFVALGVLFLVATRKAGWPARWLGLACLAAAAPFFYWLGGFAEQFDAGQCYTEAMHIVADEIDRTPDPKALAQRLRDLPMAGYETNCQEVLAATRRLAESRPPR